MNSNSTVENTKRLSCRRDSAHLTMLIVWC